MTMEYQMLLNYKKIYEPLMKIKNKLECLIYEGTLQFYSDHSRNWELNIVRTTEAVH